MITLLVIDNNKLNDFQSEVFNTDEPTQELNSHIVKLFLHHIYMGVTQPLTLIYIFNGYPLFHYQADKGTFTFCGNAMWVKDAETLEAWLQSLVKRSKEEYVEQERLKAIKQREEEKKNYISPEIKEIIDKQEEIQVNDYESRPGKILTHGIPKLKI